MKILLAFLMVTANKKGMVVIYSSSVLFQNEIVHN